MKLSFGKNKQSKKQPGRFIVIDGIDGSGKSTQLKLLDEELRANGCQTQAIHFPQHGARSAVLVDDYLAGKFGPVNARAASVFFALDRFEAAGRIRASLRQGTVVLCDRYVTANAAHQGGKIADNFERLKFFRWLDNLEYAVFGIPKPDLNIILDVPAGAAIQLLKLRGGDQRHIDKMHETSREHLVNSHKAYLEIAKLFPNTKLVKCVVNQELLPPEQIHNKVWELARRIALKDFKI